jgi:hypothetical protein
MTLTRTSFLGGLMLAASIALLDSGSHAAESDAELLSRLANSRHSLQEALDVVRAEGSTPISVKLEFEHGKLWLSVYGAKEGLDKCAEKNELFELKGDATAEKWQPTREVFQDKEHLTRASAQLTLMQTTPLTLEVALSKAEAMKKGAVYSATPVLKDGRTVIALRARTASGRAVQLVVDEKTDR